MSKGFYTVPVPVNEPIKSYTPGSPERKELVGYGRNGLFLLHTPSPSQEGSCFSLNLFTTHRFVDSYKFVFVDN